MASVHIVRVRGDELSKGVEVEARWFRAGKLPPLFFLNFGFFKLGVF